MIVYLADLAHTGQGLSPNTVPLAAGYLAASAARHFPEIEIRIFREPQPFFTALNERKPHLVGFSLHLWSERLSAYCAQCVKDLPQGTPVVVGGPSVDDLDEEIASLLHKSPAYDACISGEGERGLVRLLERLENGSESLRESPIEGCATLAEDASLLRGPYMAPDVSEIPSPYLTGWMDLFLEAGCMPVLQSMRGCPYRCAFCVSGSSSCRALRPFPLERVFEEFEYIRHKARNKTLILTDENFGILQERDVELAEYIRRSHTDHGFPEALYCYNAKIVTDHVLHIVETLKPLIGFDMSFQTLDPNVVRNIRRTNMPFDRFIEAVQWARERGIHTSTEMVFGFPGETLESYIAGLEKLLRSGVERVQSYNLRLLGGIDLSSQSARRANRYQTKFRLPERCYGRYEGHVAAEAEEVVVATTDFTYREYLTVRKYGLFLELASGCGYLSLLMNILIKLEYPGEKLVAYLAKHSFEKQPLARKLVQECLERAQAELFDTPNACEEYVRQLLSSGRQVPETKLNYVYTGKIMLDASVRAELFTVIKEFLRKIVREEALRIVLEDYLDNVLALEIVRFAPGEPKAVETHSRFDLNKAVSGAFSSSSDLMAERPAQVAMALPRDAVLFIEAHPLESTRDEALLQDIYINHRFALLRTCAANPEP